MINLRDGVTVLVRLLQELAFTMAAADTLEKAAEAVVVNQTPTAGDGAGTDPYSLVHRDLLADLDTARDAYREAKRGDDAS